MDAEYLKVNMRGLMFLGLWPNVDYKSKLKNTLYFVKGKLFILLYTTYYLNELTAVAIELDNNFTQFVRLMEFTFINCVVAPKFLNIHLGWRKIQMILDQIEFEEKRIFSRNKEEIKLYTDHLKLYNFYTKLYWSFVGANGIAVNFLRPMKYWPFWMPFDYYATQLRFIFVFVLHSCCVFLASYYTAISDTFYVGLLFFAVVQYKVIQKSLKQLHLVNQIHNDDELIDCYEELVDIAHHHLRMLTYCSNLENILTPVVVIMFSVTSLIFCTTGMGVLLSGWSLNAALSTEFLVALILQLFSYYWLANELTVESENVAKCVAEIPWYNFTNRVKHGLIVIMMRCSKPIYITIARIFPMSLETFLKILKTTYSVFVLYRYVSNKQDQ